MRKPLVPTVPRILAHGFYLIATATLAACASTSVSIVPGLQTPVCERSATALVAWAPQWRPDQKDVVARDDAALAGIQAFFAKSDCFSQVELLRIEQISPEALRSAAIRSRLAFSRVIGIEVLELGPVVKLLSSAALLEGGTEVVLQITEYSPETLAEQRRFLVHWRNGGPGVIKGVASLPKDMEDAMNAGFKSSASTAF